MKQRITAISLALLAASAGAIIVFNWNTATQDLVFSTDWDFVDKSTCDVTPCDAGACDSAQAIIDDAGFPCNVKFAACNVRVNARLRAAAAANGLTLSVAKYQHIRVPVEICTVDGGRTFGLALDDAGWPILGAVVTSTPPCVRAPLDGGLACRRDEGDGGSLFLGTGNVFSASLAVGSGCEPVECSIFFGDNSDTDL